MPAVLHNKYIYDASGKIVEIILPIHEFMELQRRAGQASIELPAQPARHDEDREELSAATMTQIALQGKAFDWLKDEPDLYSDADGEPV